MQDVNLNLAKVVVDSRKRLGLSQEALAEEANISLSTIQRIEKGTVSPRAHTIKILAKTLNLEVADLISKPDEKEEFLPNFSLLKKMNLSILLLSFLPFINTIIPLILWKTTNKAKGNLIAGKIISLQLLWGILTIIGVIMTLFLSNLIQGNAGDGLFICLLFFLLAVLFNVYQIVRTSLFLTKEDDNVLSSVPNFF
ncbi:helix-turn-helix domain-containing protein [uncultured Tenacibaculum sp.]|uniref:helix-turn-helix domain-containing protein n=1 Tax=uncultured Tenacibaculum sp. TaxID=174713 RepID=UPI0026334A99|nr:helix-turn-helix domain-containing protein [uncultured Tenacibaculum sp.]